MCDSNPKQKQKPSPNRVRISGRSKGENSIDCGSVSLRPSGQCLPMTVRTNYSVPKVMVTTNILKGNFLSNIAVELIWQNEYGTSFLRE